MESYLLKSSLIQIAFYILYRIIFNRGAHGQTKRFVGLACVLFSSLFLLLPNINIEPNESSPLIIQKVVERSSQIQESISQSIPEDKLSLVLTIYFIGVGIFSIRSILGTYFLASLYFNSQKIWRWGFKVVIVDKQISPFTYFNLLFIGKADLEKSENTALIIHEQLHRNQLHSLDNLFLEVATVLYWFNPAIWLFKQEIKSQHEFMADGQVLRNGFDKTEYQQLLFEARTGIPFMPVNYLSNQTSLKQRFIMMEKTKNTAKNNTFRIATFLMAISTIMVASAFSPALIEKISPFSAGPTFRVYTDNGEVNLERGIDKNTKNLYVRAIPTGSDIENGYLVSRVELTHVSDGQGWNQHISTDKTNLHHYFSPREAKSGDILLLTIEEYMKKDKDNVVEKIELEKPIFMNIPIQ